MYFGLKTNDGTNHLGIVGIETTQLVSAITDIEQPFQIPLFEYSEDHMYHGDLENGKIYSTLLETVDKPFIVIGLTDLTDEFDKMSEITNIHTINKTTYSK